MNNQTTDHTLMELLNHTAQHAQWPKFRISNTKTALNALAEGLGKADASQCWPIDYCKPLPILIDALNTVIVQDSKSGHVARNLKNYLRTFFKTATECGLFNLEVGLTNKMSLKRAEGLMCGAKSNSKKPAYRMPFVDWPSCLKRWWEREVPERTPNLRAVTRQNYKEALECYLGFLEAKAETTSDLYNRVNFQEFILWHAKRCDTRGITVTAQWVYHALAAAAPSKEAKQVVTNVRHKFKRAPRVHNKEREVEDLSLADLESVGLALFRDARLPVAAKAKTGGARSRDGLYRANLFRDALMLRLLVRVPMRQRCIREMQLDENLYKDRHGQWIISFRGEQLKIAQRGTEENIWKVTFPSDLCPLLDEYLRVFRPILSNGEPTVLVFPNSFGKPLTEKKVWQKLGGRVYQYIQKKFYPHLIRSIWATEMASSDADIRAVAYMMNDRMETILHKYYSHSGKGLQQRAEQRLRQILSGTKAVSLQDGATAPSPLLTI